MSIYGESLALLTDLYQLTMAFGYWKSKTADHEAVFHLFYRKNPFDGGYALAAGLDIAVEYLRDFQFDESDIEYLAQLRGNDDKQLFEQAFLDYLRKMEFSCDIDAIPEGTVVFPQEPLIRVKGPIIQCQIIETALLNIINFQSLIATKASRICLATQGDPVLEFGLRRAQGIDGSLSASRAAYIGGCAATSNVLAGKLYSIPVKGTHAHSWIMSFDSEQEAFQAYAEAMPNNCVFLVDTYDTLDGVKKAVEVGKWLRTRGHEMVGIRLDSGDLACLSIEARRIMDEAGFPKAVIVASNDLDENIITSLKEQGATIAMWGVGTKLITAHDQPAMGGVYKLSAIRKSAEESWEYRLKLSEQYAKVSNPGILQVRRYKDGKKFLADAIYDDAQWTNMTGCVIVDSPGKQKRIEEHVPYEDLLQPVFRGGMQVYDAPDIEDIRMRTQEQLGQFDSEVKQLAHPDEYPVGLEESLFDLKTNLELQMRKKQEVSNEGS